MIKVMNLDHLGIKRFFNLDHNPYQDGAVPVQIKEEIMDALNIALVVGGSIVIPHLRHSVSMTEVLGQEELL